MLLLFPIFGDFLHENVSAKKLQRYYKGIPSLGLFLFLALDILLVSLGIFYGSRSPMLTTIAASILSLLFLWNSINQNILLSIIFSLLFGGVWCILGIFYFPNIAPGILLGGSLFFSYIRFHLFKPTKQRA